MEWNLEWNPTGLIVAYQFWSADYKNSACYAL